MKLDDFSVRTYHTLKRHDITTLTPQEAIAFADRVMQGEIRNASITVAAELYRAAGLGVYNIEKRLDGRRDHDVIVLWCKRFDRLRHAPA